MTDPIQPPGDPTDAVDAVDDAAATDATEAVERAEGSDATFDVERASGARRADAAQAADPLEQAIGEVAQDIRAGAVPDAQAAADAVIIRLVNLRYAHLAAPAREKLIVQLHGLLQNDPRFQARIDDLLQVARA